MFPQSAKQFINGFQASIISHFSLAWQTWTQHLGPSTLTRLCIGMVLIKTYGGRWVEYTFDTWTTHFSCPYYSSENKLFYVGSFVQPNLYVESCHCIFVYASTKTLVWILTLFLPCNLLLLLLGSLLYLWGSPFLVRFLGMWPFFNPAIEVVTFRLHGWCMLGVFLLLCYGMHVCID